MTVPTNLVTGFLGAGKTTAIRALLADRPAGERWAVLVNEFGEVGIDGAALAADGVAVREVAGGCICCSAGLPLRVALVDLLRRARPDRLLVEPTGLGHPAGIVDTLREEHLARAIDLRAVICLVDPRRLPALVADGSEVFRDQVQIADVLIASKADRASAEELAGFRAWAAGLYPAKAAVVTAAHGRFDPALLDVAADPARSVPAGAGHAAAAAAVRPALGGLAPGYRARPGRPERALAAGLGTVGCGWVFHPDDVFDPDRLRRFLAGGGVPGLAEAERVKGVFRTGRDWTLFDRAGADLAERPVAWRRDSRVEVLAGAVPPDWDAVEAGLLGCRRE